MDKDTLLVEEEMLKNTGRRSNMSSLYGPGPRNISLRRNELILVQMIKYTRGENYLHIKLT